MTISPLALIKRFARDERGTSMVEYAVLLGIVTAAVVLTITAVGVNIDGIFQNIDATLTTANTATG